MLVDSHCHLEYEGLVEDQRSVLARAREAGIGGFLNISTRRREWDRVVATAEREPDVWASVGIHPHEADQHADLGEGALLEAAAHPRVIDVKEKAGRTGALLFVTVRHDYHQAGEIVIQEEQDIV
ncbi:MAG TPA: TatD family hydrolase, partial [Novosphingobium sp.]|nr:TatD family hydrolase [Novosphingobium sp.]